jgi:multidrug efflux pump
MLNNLIDLAINKWRSTFFIILLLFIFGINGYVKIPKESSPEVVLPFVSVSVSYRGVSPEDGERMIIKPLENQIKSISGVKKINCSAYFGAIGCTVEFQVGKITMGKALADVRDAVNVAKNEFPRGADEPVVQDYDTNSEESALNINILGDLPDDIMFKIADDLKDKITGLKEVLSVSVYGKKEHTVELIIKPETLNQYNLTTADFANIAKQNKLIVGGTFRSLDGEFNIQIPGLIENIKDLLSIPVQSSSKGVLTLGQIADIKRTYKDDTSFARLNGVRAVTLDVKKRAGENIIDAVQKVRFISDEYIKFLPESVTVIYSRDASQNIKSDLTNLNNNLILAVIIVFFVVLNLIGLRESLIIMTTIPLTFLMGILFLYLGGYTLNIVVLFALVLGTGMIVDASIVIVEYAELLIKDGVPHTEAFRRSARRMLIPVFSSVVTVLIVSMPLLFWPGIAGDFMKYLPLTLIALLSSSFIVAIFFLPCIGTRFGKSHFGGGELSLSSIEAMPISTLLAKKGGIFRYANVVWKFLQNPKKTIAGLVLLLIAVIFLYGKFNKGVVFFPDVESEFASMRIQSTGNFSLIERDKIVREVEAIISQIPDIKYYNTSVIAGRSRTLGTINLEFADWRERRKSKLILDEIREKTANIPGVSVKLESQSMGPSASKAVILDILGSDTESITETLDKIKSYMTADGNFTDIEDNSASNSIQYSLKIDREKAGKYGIDIESVGAFSSLATDGLIISDYRPSYSTDKVDIVVRFPNQYRTVNDIKNLKVPSNFGTLVPISAFATVEAERETKAINRLDQKRVVKLTANIKTGVVTSAKIEDLFGWIFKNSKELPAQVKFAGDAEDIAETQTFLSGAFATAVIVMMLLFLMQFNSLGKTIIVISSIFLSIFGVLIALMLTGQAFSVVMSGIAVMALAGIVVDSNILYIETFKDLEDKNIDMKEALLKASIIRLKPILLASITTVAGMIPMIFALSINFIERDILVGAPSSQFWTQLSAGIAGGLTFVTLLTIFITPAIILLEETLKNKIKNVFHKKRS